MPVILTYLGGGNWRVRSCRLAYPIVIVDSILQGFQGAKELYTRAQDRTLALREYGMACFCWFCGLLGWCSSGQLARAGL